MNKKIENITHGQLVDLLCTATYGSNWLDCDIAPDVRWKLDITDADCREDVWAKALLAGEQIGVIDYYAEGEIYGNLHSAVVSDDGDESVCYLISLDDIKKGLQSALDGDFEGNDNYKRWIFECVGHFLYDECEMDLPEAEALMQIIMFGELIYG